MEIIFLIVSVIVGYLFAYVYEYLAKKIGKTIHKDALYIKEYKLHHSIYGLILIATSIFFLQETKICILLIGIGIGIIIQHYFTGDGLVFITKA